MLTRMSPRPQLRPTLAALLAVQAPQAFGARVRIAKTGKMPEKGGGR